MKKEQLLNFVPKPEEKYKSTHQIALKVKQHDYVVLALLTELEHLPRPLVKKVQFGKTRMHRLWKQTKLEKKQVEVLLKIKPEDWDDFESKIILRDKFWGSINNYNKFIVKEVEKRYEQLKSEMVHPKAITKIK